MAVVTSSYNPSWLLNVGTWIAYAAEAFGLGALTFGAIHGAFAASEQLKLAGGTGSSGNSS